MEYPIPNHLKPYLVPDPREDNCEFQVTGAIRCTCGCERFAVSESNEAMIARLTCSDCGREILLFDADKHGWNGFVCHSEALDRTQPMWKAVCDECKGETFRVKVWIASQGREDFVSECVSHDPTFREEDWVDAFEWIQASLECTQCGIEIDNWLDCETM